MLESTLKQNDIIFIKSSYLFVGEFFERDDVFASV